VSASSRLRIALILGAMTSVHILDMHRADAAGMYFSDRGVRAMGRAGAFVAGADDLQAIWYNPAGLADAGTAILVDAAWLRFTPEYTRELRIVDAGGTVRHITSPTIRGTSGFLPIPTIAGSYRINPEFTMAAGIIAPYIALASYADRLENGEPSPARYTLGSFDGSALAIPGMWLSWKPIPELRLGAGVQALVGTFQSTITFSASPQDRLLGAPEQPEFDAQSQMKVGPIIAPTGNIGAIFEPEPHVRLGISFQAPMVVSSNATIKVRLPSDVAFDGARVNGETAHVRFTLPAVLRMGVELRPVDGVRVEVSYVREFWSAHDTIEAKPSGISLDGIKGAPYSVAMPNIVIPRNFVNSNSYRLGGEYTFEAWGDPITLRAGVQYETSAVPNAYLSLSSLDFVKTTLMFGGSLHFGKHWRFDGVYGHTFAHEANVTPEEAKIGRINPLKGNAPLEAVNGGTYRASADLIGVGMNYKF
jgi:long-chain fatty acid transport protein